MNNPPNPNLDYAAPKAKPRQRWLLTLSIVGASLAALYTAYWLVITWASSQPFD